MFSQRFRFSKGRKVSAPFCLFPLYFPRIKHNSFFEKNGALIFIFRIHMPIFTHFFSFFTRHGTIRKCFAQTLLGLIFAPFLIGQPCLGMGLIRTYLEETSKSVIALSILALNLHKVFCALFSVLLYRCVLIPFFTNEHENIALVQ